MSVQNQVSSTITASSSLSAEQEKTLWSKRRAYCFWARVLFSGMDLVYGKKRTLSKFKVLEIIARVPYQSWENVAYVAITHKYRSPAFARRIFEFIRESRQQQDNEQWHLLILEELIQQRQVKESMFLYGILPQIVAFMYYHLSWILYVIRPAMSYRLNADFEDHAEHEYMEFVAENPQFDEESYHSSFTKDYGEFKSLGDLFRQIGLDERHHKLESEARIDQPRFA